MRMSARFTGKRQELEAGLADAHRDRERLDGHLRDMFPGKGVDIFTVVVIVAAVRVIRKGLLKKRDKKYLKISDGRNSSRRSRDVSGLSCVW